MSIVLWYAHAMVIERCIKKSGEKSPRSVSTAVVRVRKRMGSKRCKWPHASTSSGQDTAGGSIKTLIESGPSCLGWTSANWGVRAGYRLALASVEVCEKSKRLARNGSIMPFRCFYLWRIKRAHGRLQSVVYKIARREPMLEVGMQDVYPVPQKSRAHAQND